MTRWEYATVMAAMVPIRGELELAVVQVSGHMWDYEREPVGPDDLLNIMGAEGWELVSVLTLGQTEGAEGTVWKYMLKRPSEQLLTAGIGSLENSHQTPLKVAPASTAVAAMTRTPAPSPFSADPG